MVKITKFLKSEFVKVILESAIKGSSKTIIILIISAKNIALILEAKQNLFIFGSAKIVALTILNKMTKTNYLNLSKRERQIMDILHQLGEGSVNEVLEKLTDPSGYNSIRMLMNILEKKGYLKHKSIKNKYIYFPTVKKEIAKKSALNHLMETYFDKSAPNVVSTLLTDKKITEEDLDEISKMIEKVRNNQKEQ